MEGQYQTKAKDVWANFLTYNEEEGTYEFYVSFMCKNWGKPNRVHLVFDEKGKFIETKPFVYYKLTNQTMEETIKDHMSFALHFKKMAQDLINSLIKPIKKENIIFDQEKTTSWTDGDALRIFFKVEEINYYYYLYVNDPYRNILSCTCIDEIGEYVIELDKIPSLKGLKPYVRNHPEIRVKFVNQLVGYKN